MSPRHDRLRCQGEDRHSRPRRDAERGATVPAGPPKAVASVRSSHTTTTCLLGPRIADLPVALNNVWTDHFARMLMPVLTQTIEQTTRLAVGETLRNLAYHQAAAQARWATQEGFGGGGQPATPLRAGADNVQRGARTSPAQSSRGSTPQEEGGGVVDEPDPAAERAAAAAARGEGAAGGPAPATAASPGAEEGAAAAAARGGAAAGGAPPAAADPTTVPDTFDTYDAPRPGPIATGNSPPTGRQAPIPAGALTTRQTPTGWYMGNDLHTVTEVWQLHGRIVRTTAWPTNEQQPDPTKVGGWWPKGASADGTKGGRSAQDRLRARRRKVWSAIIHAADATGLSRDAVAAQLQAIQDSTKCGISRVDVWCDDWRKAHSESTLASPTVLEIAARYQEGGTWDGSRNTARGRVRAIDGGS